LNYINAGSTIASVNFPEIDLPNDPKAHRVLNIHRNVPGVLRDINNTLSQYNISAQVLGTKGPIGYFMANVESTVSNEAKSKLMELENSIKSRVLY
jgi:D-3-phosphoglycerate dehydrogenase